MLQRDGCGCEVDEGQVILRFFGPANQQASETVEPTDRALDFPATWRSAPVPVGDRWNRLASGAFGPHMGRPFQTGQHRSHTWIGIPLVQTHVLPAGGLRCRPCDWQRRERRFQQHTVVPVGSGDHHIHRHAMAFDEHRTLHAQFAAIHRVFPGFFPPQAAPC